MSGAAAAAPTPGGSGKLTLSSTGLSCFKSGSTLVPLVCGVPVVHYKLSTLMGDALGSYGATWQLFSFHIANGDGKGSSNYLGQLPKAIWDARQSVELSIYAAALVRHSEPPAALQFNTGLGVKPGGELSFNVPDGYNWDKFLVARELNAGPNWACAEKSAWAKPEHAKQLMRVGFELHSLALCSRTSVNVEGLERAITSWCEANPKSNARYCPKEKEEAPQERSEVDPFASLAKPGPKPVAGKPGSTDPFASLESGRPRGGPAPSQDMEGAFEKAEAERVAAEKRKRVYEAARASCERDLAKQESCSKNSCGSEPPLEICVRRADDPNPPVALGLFVPIYRCIAKGPNPNHAKWNSCLRDAATQCAVQGKKITSLSSCTSEREK